MSLSIEGIHEHEDGGLEENTGAPSILNSVVTKQHIDKVDLEIDMLYKKAETIIIDQNHQREKQK